MLTPLLLALSLATSLTPWLTTELVLVRSRMGPLVRVSQDGTLVPVGPASPRGFGMEAGRLRHLATSTTVGVVVVEVAAADGGALFTIPLDGRPPVELTKTTALGLDVALSPDGRRLLYEDQRTPRVVTLVAAAPAPPAVTIATHRPLPAATLDIRIDRPRWRDDHTIVYERATDHRDTNRISTTIEVAPADGSARAELLVPPSGAQDRLAALVGDSVLFYRDGILHRYAPGRAPTPTRAGREAGVVAVTRDHARAILAVGARGVTRDNALAIIDAAGDIHEIGRRRSTYLDPLLDPDGAHMLWSVATPRGWVVERIALDGSGTQTIGPARPDPIELVTPVPGSALVAGCRGDEVVVVDTARADTRVLTRAPGNPSCTIRGATTTTIVFERKLDDAWRLELLPLDPARAPVAAPAGASVASASAVAGDVVVAQTGWDGVGTIVARALGREVPQVPWQYDDIRDARRTPDGSAVVYRLGAEPVWYATTLAAPGVIVPVTGRVPNVSFIGLTSERLVGWEAGRFLGWRIDGRDADGPAVLLSGIAYPSPFAADHARVTGVTPQGELVSAAATPGATATPLLRGVRPWSLAYDRAHGRVVATALYESRLTILAVDVLGRDVDRPHVLGHARPPESAGLGHVDVLASGNVALRYETTTTAVPHAAGFDVLAANGSGYRERAAAIAALTPTPPARPFTTAPDEWSGAELSTPIR